jgi:osmotically-inducible protein OsmY
MDTLKQRYAMIFALILMGSVSGCAAYRACGFHGCAGDAQIASNVQASIDQYSDLGPNLIDVQTMDHVVYLYGLVNTDMERQLAEAAARGTPGVVRVVNSIAVNNRG